MKAEVTKSEPTVTLTMSRTEAHQLLQIVGHTSDFDVQKRFAKGALFDMTEAEPLPEDFNDQMYVALKKGVQDAYQI